MPSIQYLFYVSMRTVAGKTLNEEFCGPNGRKSAEWLSFLRMSSWMLCEMINDSFTMFVEASDVIFE